MTIKTTIENTKRTQLDNSEHCLSWTQSVAGANSIRLVDRKGVVMFFETADIDDVADMFSELAAAIRSQ